MSFGLRFLFCFFLSYQNIVFFGGFVCWLSIGSCCFLIDQNGVFFFVCMIEVLIDFDVESIKKSFVSFNLGKSSWMFCFMCCFFNIFVFNSRKVGFLFIFLIVMEENVVEVVVVFRVIMVIFFVLLVQLSIVVFMGDVNVQFFDNFLWKCWSICFDS